MHNRLFSRASSVLLACSLVLLTACGGSSSDTTQAATPTDTTTTDNDTNTQTTVKPIEVAGKVYLDTTGTDMLILNAGNNGIKKVTTGQKPNVHDLGEVASKYYTSVPLTWNLSGNELTIASAASANGQETLKVSTDSNSLTGRSFFNNTPATYTVAKPLSVAALDGKLLTEKFATGSYCSSRIFSFTQNTMKVQEACGYTSNEFSLTLEAVDWSKDILQAYGNINGKRIAVYITLRDGSVENNGTLLFSSNESSAYFTSTRATTFTATSFAPGEVQLIATPSPPSNFTAPMTVCKTLRLHNFMCTIENFQSFESNVDIEKCQYTPALWFVQPAILNCSSKVALSIDDLPGIKMVGYYFYSDGETNYQYSEVNVTQ